jgi:hypothetical protein
MKENRGGGPRTLGGLLLGLAAATVAIHLQMEAWEAGAILVMVSAGSTLLATGLWLKL